MDPKRVVRVDFARTRKPLQVGRRFLRVKGVKGMMEMHLFRFPSNRKVHEKQLLTLSGLNGKLATHSLRKSFAQRVYEESSDIYLVQELLGHRNVSTTQKYIGVNYATARETVEAIALAAEASSSEFYRTSLLYNSLNDITDETLIKELRKRGYNRLDLRENQTTAEIVKIG